MELPQVQYEVMVGLSSASGAPRLPDLAASLKRDQSQVSAACVELQGLGYVLVEEAPYDELSLGKEGEAYVASPLPERIVLDVLVAQQGRCKVTEVPTFCALNASQVGQSLRWLTQRGWARKEGDTLVLSDAGRAAKGHRTPDENLLVALSGGKPARKDELAARGIDVDAAVALLAPRKGVLNVKPRVDRRVVLTDSGRKLATAGISGRRAVTQLTPDLLTDGAWKNVDLQPYDVTLAAKTVFPGKEHAFQRTLEKVRRVFLEMGFEEIVSPWIESSFWDFDALFQPQDHPARDMQDTFYIAKPERCRLPDEALVERTRRTHEDGGDTGSTGWRYRWSRELAQKPVLRTHTTAATIRALAKHAMPNGECRVANNELPDSTRDQLVTRYSSLDTPRQRPGKYFVIGPVYRRETADYKHLPMFHQVDGIIVDREASLATLLGTLSAFYGKMGFPKVRFRPSFFPYTEPSAEVFLWLEGRQEWVEMGGSGLFRPEVTLPLGITDRVLAWGLGLERLAMMIHGLKSIGDLYFATMPWLREAPLSRA
ncbi:MAG: phenylalanine--tRNA ligase subunit alpha [Planctomycetes bacterium]|nr:phenylalanine--tRNA ligase subunit alpha [Planctomycetota bacterium]